MLPFLLAVASADTRKLANPCLAEPFSSMPFCNASLTHDQRARDAVGRMSLKEKIDALGTKQGPTPSLGLGKYDWWSEATSGVANGAHGADGFHTHFAYPVTTGMAFNRSLWRVTGEAIGREARALMNAGKAYSTLWTPVVNLARDPRWGRNVEVPGEDPFLTGAYAVEFIAGLQNEQGGFLQASACCKHFVANELEKTTQLDGEEWDRRHDNAQVTERDLLDSYLPPFEACVRAGVSGLMCSYNSLNGVPACASKKLIDTAKTWGFDGYVTSDCDADRNVYNTHKYAATRAEAVCAVWKSTSELGYIAWTLVSLHAIEPTRSRGQLRVDGVGRPKFDFHTGPRRPNGGHRRRLWGIREPPRTVRARRGPD
jgi:pre-mRNA-splicing factor SYF2/beta-D-xylosidase 4